MSKTPTKENDVDVVLNNHLKYMKLIELINKRAIGVIGYKQDYTELDNRPILAILESRNYGTIIARDLEGVKLIKETLIFIKKDMLIAQQNSDEVTKV